MLTIIWHESMTTVTITTPHEKEIVSEEAVTIIATQEDYNQVLRLAGLIS